MLHPREARRERTHVAARIAGDLHRPPTRPPPPPPTRPPPSAKKTAKTTGNELHDYMAQLEAEEDWTTHPEHTPGRPVATKPDLPITNPRLDELLAALGRDDLTPEELSAIRDAAADIPPPPPPPNTMKKRETTDQKALREGHEFVERQNKKAAVNKPTADELANRAKTLRKKEEQKPIAAKPAAEDTSLQGTLRMALNQRCNVIQAKDEEEENENDEWTEEEQPLQRRSARIQAKKEAEKVKAKAKETKEAILYSHLPVHHT